MIRVVRALLTFDELLARLVQAIARAVIAWAEFVGLFTRIKQRFRRVARCAARGLGGLMTSRTPMGVAQAHGKGPCVMSRTARVRS